MQKVIFNINQALGSSVYFQGEKKEKRLPSLYFIFKITSKLFSRRGKRPFPADLGTENRFRCRLDIPSLWVLRHISGREHCLDLTIHVHITSFLLLSTAWWSYFEKCPTIGERVAKEQLRRRDTVKESCRSKNIGNHPSGGWFRKQAFF